MAENRKLTQEEKDLIRRYVNSILREISRNPYTNSYLKQQAKLLYELIGD